MNNPLLSVITLPVLAPIVALLQLLFPSLMRNQYQQYKAAIHTSLAQSSLMGVHWITVQWFVKQRIWWLGDEALTIGLLVIAVIGLLASVRNRLLAQKTPSDLASGPPTRLEVISFALFAIAGVGWAVYQWRIGGSMLDPMFALTAACGVGLAHLALRSQRTPATKASQTHFVSTELAFLAAAAVVAAGVIVYQRDNQPQQLAASVATDWPTYRGNPQRTGDRDGQPILRPKVLWTFAPPLRKGRVRMHSSPAVVDNQLYIGAMHQVQTLTQGLLYCINIDDALAAVEKTAPGELLWKYTAEGTLKPVFSSPSIADGKIFFGEGYHQDTQCRLFCLDARSGKEAWTALTQSHVESSPAIEEEKVFVGAGDDGLLCFPRTASGTATKSLWQVKNLHVDAAPLVAKGQVVVGSVLGDIQKDFAIVAANAKTGEETWRVVAPMPVPGSPTLAADGGSIYVGLGRGKMDHDDDMPEGAVWRLGLSKGDKEWEFPLPNAVLGAPVALEGRVLFGCRDGFCYCVADKTGDLLWKHDCGDPVVTSPAASEKQVIVLTTAGVLIALDPATGKEQWRLEDLRTDDLDAYASPVIVRGRIYVAVGGKVHCVGEE